MKQRPSVGDILVSEWGYSMMMVSFFKVVAHKGQQTLVLHELQQKTVKHYDFLNGETVPTDELTIPANPRVAAGNGEWEEQGDFVVRWNPAGYAKLASFAYARPWDGLPRRFDHCD